MSYAKNFLKMDKIDRLLDAIEHPERYSDQELEAMLANPEARDVYDMLDKTKASLAPISTPDIDVEWAAFKNAHSCGRQQHGSFRIFSLFSRNIAASIAIGVASLAAVATVVGVSVNYALNNKTEEVPVHEVAIVENTTSVPTDTIVVEDTPVAAPETIVFDNEPLETIISHIAEYYGYKAEFSTDAPKTLRLYFRWNQAQTIEEVVESLNNFEQIHLTVKDKTIKID